MKLSYLLLLASIVSFSSACPCTFQEDAGEIICQPGSISILPFQLPDCMSETVQNEKVKRLILTDQELPTVFAHSFDIFTNLEYLDLSSSKIERVDPFAFAGNKKIGTLILTGNNIINLPNLYESLENSL